MPLVLDGTNGVSGVDGTASNPSYEGTDSNTGIFYPAADTVAIGTGGTEALRVNSSQQVGIGTQSPTTILNIEKSAPSASVDILVRNTGTDGTSNARIMSFVSSASGGDPKIGVGITGVQDYFWYIDNSDSDKLKLDSNGSDLLTVTSAGNVGIGTSSPANKLHVVGTAAINLIRAQAASSGDSVVLRPNAAGNGGDVFSVNDAQTAYTPLNVIGSTVVFLSGTGGTERARITSGGDLLVGTTTSAAPLTVYAPTATSTGARVALFKSTSDSDNANECVGLVKKSTTNTTANVFQRFYISDGSTGSGQINANGASAAAFGTQSDARLKENIIDLPPQLQNILALRPVEFDYIESEGGGHQLGFIAQEVQSVYPDLVGERADGMLTLTDLNKNDARLIKAFQELAAKVTALEAEIAALKGNA